MPATRRPAAVANSSNSRTHGTGVFLLRNVSTDMRRPRAVRGGLQPSWRVLDARPLAEMLKKWSAKALAKFHGALP